MSNSIETKGDSNMKTNARYILLFTLALFVGSTLWITLIRAAPSYAPQAGGVPSVVAYQGEVSVSSIPYTGNGYFKFAVINAASNTSFWSNDGTSSGGTAPTNAVALSVSHGLFSVLLGDTTLGGMSQPLSASVFSEPDRYLRVWFSASANGPFDQLTPDTRIAAVPYALSASDADTLDGLHASQLGGHYQNVVMVAKSGGDYTNVQAAIASISDATAGNPYLVWVAPGVYSETVTLKPFVHLQGSGQAATVITSTASSTNFPPTQATLELASDTSLRDLTVGNGGTGERNTALLATVGVSNTLVTNITARSQGSGTDNIAIFQSGSGTEVTLNEVTALAENGERNYGLLHYDGAAAILHGGSFTGRGGTHTRGIQLRGSGTTLVAKSVTGLAEGASMDNYSLYNHNGALATLHGGDFTARGGSGNSWGIYNRDTGTMVIVEQTVVLAEGSFSDHIGLRNRDGATARLHGASFTARGGTHAWGIFNTDSGTILEAEGTTVLAEDSGYNYGLVNSLGATATVRNGSFSARAGTNIWGYRNAYGIHNKDNGTTLTVEGVTVLAEDCEPYNIGLYNESGAVREAAWCFFHCTRRRLCLGHSQPW